MATWKPARIGETTSWIEPPQPSERNWRTTCDYERNHQHNQDFGEQITEAVVAWGCGCGARQYEYNPAPDPVHAVSYGPVDFEYAGTSVAARGSSQTRRSDCSPWLLLPVVVIVIVVLIELRSGG